MSRGLSGLFLSPSHGHDEYTFFTDRWVKIWFSTQPDVFMSLEMFQKLEKFLRENPEKWLTLFYSSDIITPVAQYSFRQFMHSLPEKLKQNFVPIDIDTKAFQDELASNEEKILYGILKQELKNLNRGGSVAAASDILRVLSPSWLRGIYIDFSDVEIHFPSRNVVVKNDAPVLIPKNENAYGNDVIMPSIDLKAVEIIFKEIVKIIIKNYQNPENCIDPLIFTEMRDNKAFRESIEACFNPRDGSIVVGIQWLFNFRRSLREKIDESSNSDNFRKAYIKFYKNTVIKITGSEVMRMMKEKLGSYVDNKELDLFIQSQINSFRKNSGSWIPGIAKKDDVSETPRANF